MSDITKCKGQDTLETCPMRATCYRFTAPANEWRQSYFMGLPINRAEGQTVKDCQEYWPIEEVTK